MKRFIVLTNKEIIDTSKTESVVVNDMLYIKLEEKWGCVGRAENQYQTIKEVVEFHNEMIRRKKHEKENQ